MSYSYTNRKGTKYYLCQGVTKTNNPRYFFARQPQGTSIEEIPVGYQVEESLNGIVSLVKVYPRIIFPEEFASVETELKNNPKGIQFRAVAKKNMIVIYESPQPGGFTKILTELGWNLPKDVVHEQVERFGQFSPIMRFILKDPEERIFIPQRWCFLGGRDEWINILDCGKIEILAKQLIPALGTEEYFELY